MKVCLDTYVWKYGKIFFRLCQLAHNCQNSYPLLYQPVTLWHHGIDRLFWLPTYMWRPPINITFGFTGGLDLAFHISTNVTGTNSICLSTMELSFSWRTSKSLSKAMIHCSAATTAVKVLSKKSWTLSCQMSLASDENAWIIFAWSLYILGGLILAFKCLSSLN